jgi:hypothetical protein
MSLLFHKKFNFVRVEIILRTSGQSKWIAILFRETGKPGFKYA